MPARAPPLRTLLRAPIHPKPVPRPTLHQYSFPQRSTSPPPVLGLQRRNASPPSNTHWTRFSTPYSLSSIRTFSTSHPPRKEPRNTATTHTEVRNAATDADAARRIEEVIEDIQELYATARDEFDIAHEETAKNTQYAADDRAAAREELDALLEFYASVVEGEDRGVAEEVVRRVGGKVRELEVGVRGMEEGVGRD
ncbi:hypothetical protein EJ04DRAFT_551883 [Polyplosphaeria fusca]|uniref:Uncharacterized protein n=1 Tax=Polyplosphaeria fusca TaxID=682080 RepID=A0A9P4V3P0_9PLEO|nr:hypothetical protein EJ04DRAFT_551883 [Polyplosphaeria fusca]